MFYERLLGLQSAQTDDQRAIDIKMKLTIGTYLPKVGSPGSLGYREIFSIYREICQNPEFFEKFLADCR